MRSGGRSRLLGAVVATLVLTGCAEETPEDAALRAAVEKARDHNAVVGVALGLLGVLVLRHLVLLLAARRAARRADRQRALPLPDRDPALPRPGPALVAAALVHELLATTSLGVAAYVLGWLAGPVPAGYSGDLESALVGLFLGPAAVVAGGVAVAVQLVAARLPYARAGAFRLLAVVDVLVAGVLVLVWWGDPHVMGMYLLPVPLAVVAAAGFRAEARRVRRLTRPG